MIEDMKDSTAETAATADEAMALPETATIVAEEATPVVAETTPAPVKTRKTKVAAAKAAKLPEAELPAKAVETIEAKPAKAARKAKPVVKAAAKPAAEKTKPAKTKVAKAPVAKASKASAPMPTPTAVVKPATKRPFTATPRVKLNSAAQKATTAPRKELFAMATTTTEITEKMSVAFKEAQEKAKVALEKSQAAMGDVSEFAKGNVEAVVESTKILASGLQEMTKGYVAESKSAFEAMTADVKDLTTVSSPTEFFEKQSALMRKNFDAAVAASSKNSEAMLKLATEAFQPISTRVSLAVEKMKKAA